VPIDHCVSHAYEEMGNTVSCYFLDPEGNRLEIYALVPERDDARINRPLDSGQERRRYRRTGQRPLRRWPLTTGFYFLWS
jgi:hypothetical protein